MFKFILKKKGNLSFRVGFPVDGQSDYYLAYEVNADNYKDHNTKNLENESKCSDRATIGGQYVFYRLNQNLQKKLRLQYVIIYPHDLKNFDPPDNLYNDGSSDSATCALAVAQGKKQQRNSPLVLVSCELEDSKSTEYGFLYSKLSKVTKLESEIAAQSLLNKWKATKNSGALALVLHKHDAQILCQKYSEIKSISLEEHTFQRLSLRYNSHKEAFIPPVVSCDYSELPKLAKSLNIQTTLFEQDKKNKYLLFTCIFVFVIFILYLFSLFKEKEEEKIVYEENELQNKISTLLDSTEDSFMLVAMHCRNTLTTNEDKILTLLKRGVDVRFLVLNPSAEDIISQREKDTRKHEGELLDECKNGIKLLKEFKEKWNRIQGRKGLLEIRLYKVTPYFRAYLFDLDENNDNVNKNTYLFVNMYIPQRSTKGTTHLLYDKKDISSYLKTINELWINSENNFK